METARRADVWPLVGRIVRFGTVGVANTAVYYFVYRLLLPVMPYLAAHLIAFACGMVFSFFANCRFTFHVRPTWRGFLEFPATTLVNFVTQTLGTWLVVSQGWLPKQWATLATAILAIPVTYLATAFVLTRGRG